MKAIILYYSETGNTKKVAESLDKHFNIKSKSIIDYPDIKLNDYDLIIFGTPVHSDNIPEKVREFINKYENLNKKFAIYCIHAGPESLLSHTKCLNAFQKLFNTKKGKVVGKLNILGENKNPEVIEWLRVNMPERYKILPYSHGHPDENDVNKAISWLGNIINNLSIESK